MEAVKAEDMNWSRATEAGSSSLIIVILLNKLFSRGLKLKGQGCLFLSQGALSRIYASLALFACAVRLCCFIRRKRLFPLHSIRRSRFVGVPGVILVRPLTHVVMRTVTCAEYWSKISSGFRILRVCVNVHLTSFQSIRTRVL